MLNTVYMRNEIEQLIQDGELWNYLNNCLSQDVLVAYQETFGVVQILSTEKRWLSHIVNKLLGSGSEERQLFGDHLSALTQKKAGDVNTKANEKIPSEKDCESEEEINEWAYLWL